MATKHKALQRLEDGNLFLTYPRDMMEDINDKYPIAIEDYSIEDSNFLFLTLSEVGKDNWTAIKKLIAEM